MGGHTSVDMVSVWYSSLSSAVVEVQLKYGPKRLRTFQTSDLGHFGMSKCPNTLAHLDTFGSLHAGLDSLVVTA